MLPDESDAARLWDMLTYAREIVQTLTGKRFADYLRDKNLRLATERRIEIIGEAARNVSDEFKSTHDRVPWRKIVGMRHVLVRQRKSGPFRVAGVLARASGGRPAHQNPLFSSDSAGETPAGRAAETAATRTCAVVLAQGDRREPWVTCFSSHEPQRGDRSDPLLRASRGYVKSRRTQPFVYFLPGLDSNQE